MRQRRNNHDTRLSELANLFSRKYPQPQTLSALRRDVAKTLNPKISHHALKRDPPFSHLSILYSPFPVEQLTFSTLPCLFALILAQSGQHH